MDNSSLFAQRPQRDHAALIVFAVIAWIAVLYGFGTDIDRHIHRHDRVYPLLTYIHSVVFTGWLALFTTQILLIRSGRVDIHRKLGFAGLVLAAVMCVVGPATAINTQRWYFDHHGKGLPFLIVQLGGMCIFAGLVIAAVVLRRNPAAHKRLMVLATMMLIEAAFFRILIPYIGMVIGYSPINMLISSWWGTVILFAGAAAYDLLTYRRLHPVFAIFIPLDIAIQLSFALIFLSPGWLPIARMVIGR